MMMAGFTAVGVDNTVSMVPTVSMIEDTVTGIVGDAECAAGYNEMLEWDAEVTNAAIRSILSRHMYQYNSLEITDDIIDAYVESTMTPFTGEGEDGVDYGDTDDDGERDGDPSEEDAENNAGDSEAAPSEQRTVDHERTSMMVNSALACSLIHGTSE